MSYEGGGYMSYEEEDTCHMRHGGLAISLFMNKIHLHISTTNTLATDQQHNSNTSATHEPHISNIT